MATDNGGPAFPRGQGEHEQGEEVQEGMSVLDYVAADLFGKLVIQMESRRGGREASNVVGSDAAHDAYYYAEMFVAERAKRMPVEEPAPDLGEEEDEGRAGGADDTDTG